MLTAERILAVANRGATHLFLGHPLSETADKTCVEPGNGFSPGLGTCGVSLWAAAGEAAPACADELPEEAIGWHFFPTPDDPTVVSDYTLAGVQVRHELYQAAAEDARTVDAARVVLKAPAARAFTAWLVVRGWGPAGGPVERLAWEAEQQSLQIGEDLHLVAETTVAEAAILQTGEAREPVVGLLRFEFDGPGELRYRVLHRPSAFAPGAAPAAGSVAGARQHARAAWQETLPAQVFAPDARLAATWSRCAAHLQAAMEGGMPRLGVLNYPTFWIRDCVLVLRALDLMGRHDLARPGTQYLTTLDFGGGFGAESDAPGQGLWALVGHARLGGDPDFLTRAWPALQRKVALLEEELAATRPLRRFAEGRIPRYQTRPDINLFCYAAQQGLIHGRMDHHSPDFYINCWAWAGLEAAAWAAEALGREGEAARWRRQAEALEAAIAQRLLPEYGNDRDPVVTPWPTGCLRGWEDGVRQRFCDWYTRHRLDAGGRRRPEPHWPYFEVAQIHNAVLLGRRDLAWACLDGLLAPEGTWETAIWGEGPPGGSEHLPFENGGGVRGWLRPGRARAGNMPHCWAAAEVLALLRDLLVHEGDGELVLGAGVPPTWLQPGCEFGVRRLPTMRGEVSYTVTVPANGAAVLHYEGPQPYRVAWAQR